MKDPLSDMAYNKKQSCSDEGKEMIVDDKGKAGIMEEGMPLCCTPHVAERMRRFFSSIWFIFKGSNTFFTVKTSLAYLM